MKALDKSLCGAAGVHYVASQLSMRGMIALITLRNTRGIDLVVLNADGSKHASIQVKTRQRRSSHWLVGTRFDEFRGPTSYYVFVRWLPSKQFEAFLEAADCVAEESLRRIRAGRKRGNKTFAPSWDLPRDSASVERLRQQWEDFKL
jgi:hypothetical protein